MRKIASLLIILLLLSINSPVFASSNELLPVKSSSATIKIEKGQSTSKAKKLELKLDSPTSYVGDEKYDNRVSPLVTYQNGSSGYISAEEVKLTTSNSKVVSVEKTGNVVPKSAGKAVISGTYKGLKAKVTITVKPAGTGEFSIQFKEDVDYANTYFQYVRKYGNNKADYYYNYADLKSSKTSNGYKLTKINWDKYPKIYGTISANGKVYYIEVTEKQNKKTIILDPSELQEVTINYPSNDVVTDSFTISKMDSNKKFTYGGSVHGSDKLYIQKGNYNIQVQAKDSDKLYNIFLKNQSIKGKKEINISSSSLALASFKVKESGSNKLLLQNVGGYDWNLFNHISSVYVSSSSTDIYMSKMKYSYLAADVLVNNKWRYNYRFKDKEISGNQSFIIGDQLSASISFNNKYKLFAGSPVSLPAYESWGHGSLKIKDQYGNLVVRITSDDYRQQVEGVLVFKSNKKTYRIPLNSLEYGQVTLPSEPGTYKVSFELK